MILNSNAFRFGNESFRQITGTAMGSPMAPAMLTYSSTILRRTYCVIILKKPDYHFLCGFVLLTVFSSFSTKSTDSHFYLNTSSCHPLDVPKNKQKGQFGRLQRKCSRKSDYLLNSEILCKKFSERGFHEKE